MAPSRGATKSWISLHNNTNVPKRFTFEVKNTSISGSVMVEADESINIFRGKKGCAYHICVKTEDSQAEKHEWELVEGNESLVAELTQGEFRFKEMDIL